jgi:regulator of protease activity HflC (stomatin/prohibitin superfamily)
VLSSDGVTLKVSLAANFAIADPNVAGNKVSSYKEALYLELQLALREIIGTTDIDTLFDGCGAFSNRLMEIAEPKAAALGLNLISVNLKVFACSLSVSALVSLRDSSPAPNTSTAWSLSCAFHCLTWFECTSKRPANSASATFALNPGA